MQWWMILCNPRQDHTRATILRYYVERSGSVGIGKRPVLTVWVGYRFPRLPTWGILMARLCHYFTCPVSERVSRYQRYLFMAATRGWLVRSFEVGERLYYSPLV